MEFQILKAELSDKPGTWKLLGLFFAALAIPFLVVAVWVPREFDSLRALAIEARDQSLAAATAAVSAETESKGVAKKTDDLIFASARENAHRISLIYDNGHLIMSNLLGLRKILPSNLYEKIESDGKLNAFFYTEFMMEKRVFVSGEDFNTLTSEEQSKFQASIDRVDAIFIFE